MKKIIIIAIPSVLLMAIIGIYVFIPSILPVWLVIRHVGIYLLFTYVTVLGSVWIYKFLITKAHTSVRLWLIRGLVLISGGIILLGGSELQLYLVDAYEIPPITGCVYYDKYDNLIYNSQYRGTCPELENLTYTTFSPETIQDSLRETLSFDVKETAFNVIDNEEHSYHLSVKIELEYEPIDAFQVVVGTTQEKSIQMIRIESEELVHVRNQETGITSHLQNRYLKIVENEFGEMLLDSEVTESTTRSTITEYSDSQVYTIDIDEIDGLESSDITTLEPVITIQEAIYTEIPDEGYGFDGETNEVLNHYYDIEMTEQVMANGTESSPIIFAEGKRMNTVNSVNLIPNVPYSQTIGYRSTYGESRWWSFSERYDISKSSVYPSRDVEIGYHYYNDVFQSDELKHLDYYTKTDVKYETTEEVSIKKYEREESAYLIDQGRSIEVIQTDYGKKLTYFSTNRADDGKYTIYPDTISELIEDDIIYSDFMPLTMFYNSKAILFDVSTFKPLYMIQQNNLLFYGVESGVLVYL
ncbi:MAG: hypothetical protein JEZ05_00400 [Tenericutes bacterium]|nr:hypothetical protein [Mycoplasmatota bacterium]